MAAMPAELPASFHPVCQSACKVRGVAGRFPRANDIKEPLIETPFLSSQPSAAQGSCFRKNTGAERPSGLGFQVRNSNGRKKEKAHNEPQQGRLSCLYTSSLKGVIHSCALTAAVRGRGRRALSSLLA